jgi:release factor glutamine methyltransferase
MHDPRIPDLIRHADVIVSNPPYINTDVIASLSAEVQHEPHIALDGGIAGMDFYRRFVLDYIPLMKEGAVMILEIGYDQAERIRALCQLIGASCTIHRDFGGNDRVAEISRTSPQDPA